MRITIKGQVTIPIQYREKYGLLPESEIEFIEDKGRLYLKKIEGKQLRGRNVVERLRGSATVKMTTDEILALTRGDK